MKKLNILLILITLGFSSCMTREVRVVVKEDRSGRPSWVFYPNPGGKYRFGGVGSAGRSSRGIAGQRDIAISRAIDELARQLGISVNNVVESTQTEHRSTYQSYSLQSTTGEVFSARLMEIWIDESTNELFAWMVIE